MLKKKKKKILQNKNKLIYLLYYKKKNIIIRTLKNNNQLLFKQLIVLNMQQKFNYTVKRACFLTGKKKALNTKYQLNRHIMTALLQNNILPNITIHTTK